MLILSIIVIIALIIFLAEHIEIASVGIMIFFAYLFFTLCYNSFAEGEYIWGVYLFFIGAIIVFGLIRYIFKQESEDNKQNNYNINNRTQSIKKTNYQSYNKSSSIINKKRNYNEMTGIEFEKYCCNVLKYRGFKSIQRTPDSCDNGVDIVAYYYNNKYAIQCKRYSGKVGNKAVQEVYSGKKYYKCEYAMVISNSTYTKAAINLAKELKVKLVTL